MFRRFKASAIKDLLILSRDKAGLAILFFMPVMLIFIMTVIQDSAYNTMSQSGLPVLFVDNDRDSLGLSIGHGLKSSGLVELVTMNNGEAYTVDEAQLAVSEGRYLLAIVIPEGASEAIRTSVARNIERALIDEGATYDPLKEVEIVILIDPGAQQGFVNTVTSMLREFISEMKTKLVFETFAIELAAMLPEGNEPEFDNKDVVKYRQQYATSEKAKIFPNSVQHNVPAWTIFAMFFIIIPLSVSLIKEKSEGSMIRLKTLPGSYLDVLIGKFLVFFVVCNIQFVLMMLVGIVVLPLVGLPVLNLGGNLAAVAVIALSNAFAATAAGLLLGTMATTHQQATIGGSVAVLILAAIGGIWVPTYVMPDLMEQLSVISPLNWGLTGFYNIFLRGSGTLDVLPEAARLIVFGLVMISLSYFYQKFRTD